MQGDEGAAKLKEGQMDVSPVLVADLQAPEAVEPGERPFDHPAVGPPGPRPGAVRPWASAAPTGAAARSAPTTHQATAPSPWHPPPWLLFCFLGCLRDGFVRRTKAEEATLEPLAIC